MVGEERGARLHPASSIPFLYEAQAGGSFACAFHLWKLSHASVNVLHHGWDIPQHGALSAAGVRCWHGSFTLRLSGDDYFDLRPGKASGSCQRRHVKRQWCKSTGCGLKEVGTEMHSSLLGPSHSSEWWFLDPLRATEYRNRCKESGSVAAAGLQLIFPTAHCLSAEQNVEMGGFRSGGAACIQVLVRITAVGESHQMTATSPAAGLRFDTSNASDKPHY